MTELSGDVLDALAADADLRAWWERAGAQERSDFILCAQMWEQLIGPEEVVEMLRTMFIEGKQ
jgi:hypothetical protein